MKADADEINTAQSDLDFEVSTNPETVRRFLDAPFQGTKIVFSTYQSAAVIGSAMNPDESFDLGVFDEAHKTAGREGRNYGYALDDSNIPIGRRLFVTATPRHYNPSLRTKEGEATVAIAECLINSKTITNLEIGLLVYVLGKINSLMNA